MVKGFVDMFQINPARATAVLVSMLIVLSLLVWVSLIDLKRKSVTFWKILIASGSIIVTTLFVSLFYNCKALASLKWSLIYSIPLWFFILYLNIKFNYDRFIGKADVDLLSSIVSIGICYSSWLYKTFDPEVSVIRILSFWYNILGYIILGALIYSNIYSIYGV